MPLPSPEPILAALVGFDTTSHGSNLALIQWVEEYLARYDVPCVRVNESKTKASLLARIGPDVPGGIVLSGHTDVVPVTDQPWTSDPFTLTPRGQKYFGRGTSDMKTYLACALALVPLWRKMTLQKPIWLAFSHDEEIGCLGAAPMARHLVEIGAAPSLVIVGEPTEMKLVNAHKGILSFETIVTGHAAHSSRPELGVNAVHVMGEILVCLERLRVRAAEMPEANSPFHPPFSTVHVGVIEGGTARNIIPHHCRIAWEIRPLPTEKTEILLAEFQSVTTALERRMKAQFPHTSIVTRAMSNVRGLRPEPEADFTALAMHLAQTNTALAVAYGTEGGIFQSHGLPVVVCGPGAIDQAHQPDEWIAREQVEACMDFLARVGEYCAKLEGM
jgi:acetylornithine deacetylase